MDKIRTQLATHGLSEASLQLGNPYSGVRKSQEGAKEKEMAELRKRVQRLENPSKKQPLNSKPEKPDKPVSKLQGKLARTCRNWNLGLCTKSDAECNRRHACNHVVDGDRVCWGAHRKQDHEEVTTTFT